MLQAGVKRLDLVFEKPKLAKQAIEQESMMVACGPPMPVAVAESCCALAKCEIG